MSDGQILLTADEYVRISNAHVIACIQGDEQQMRLAAQLDDHDAALRAERDHLGDLYRKADAGRRLAIRERDQAIRERDGWQESWEAMRDVAASYERGRMAVEARERTLREALTEEVEKHREARALYEADVADLAAARDRAVNTIEAYSDERDEARAATLVLRAAAGKASVMCSHGAGRGDIRAVLDAALAGTSPPADEYEQVGWRRKANGSMTIQPTAIEREQFPDVWEPVYVRRPAEPVVVDPPTERLPDWSARAKAPWLENIDGPPAPRLFSRAAPTPEPERCPNRCHNGLVPATGRGSDGYEPCDWPGHSGVRTTTDENCERCGGSGIDPDLTGGYEGTPSFRDYEACVNCGGSGVRTTDQEDAT